MTTETTLSKNSQFQQWSMMTLLAHLATLAACVQVIAGITFAVMHHQGAFYSGMIITGGLEILVFRYLTVLFLEKTIQTGCKLSADPKSIEQKITQFLQRLALVSDPRIDAFQSEDWKGQIRSLWPGIDCN